MQLYKVRIAVSCSWFVFNCFYSRSRGPDSLLCIFMIFAYIYGPANRKFSFESNHESNRRLRFQFESNLESNQGVVV